MLKSLYNEFLKCAETEFFNVLKTLQEQRRNQNLFGKYNQYQDSNATPENAYENSSPHDQMKMVPVQNSQSIFDMNGNPSNRAMESDVPIIDEPEKRLFMSEEEEEIKVANYDQMDQRRH